MMGTMTSFSAASLIDDISGVENRLGVQPPWPSPRPCPHGGHGTKVKGKWQGDWKSFGGREGDGAKRPAREAGWGPSAPWCLRDRDFGMGLIWGCLALGPPSPGPHLARGKWATGQPWIGAWAKHQGTERGTSESLNWDKGLPGGDRGAQEKPCWCQSEGPQAANTLTQGPV